MRRGVRLVSMPLSSPHFPNLALGLLQPAVAAVGAACETSYFSLDYVGHVGEDAHAALTDVRTYMAHVGEWVFAGCAHGRETDADEAFLTEVFARDFPAFHEPFRLLAFLAAREGAPAFIEQCYRAVDWSTVGIVGFTSSFQQTMASLALARRIKRDHPGIVVVFGGANVQDAMGVELLRLYGCVDAVCVGEGDRALPALVRQVLDGGGCGRVPGGVPGIAVRGAVAVAAEPVTDLDALPLPVFDAFFERHAALQLAARHPPAVVFETARGCWWGAVQHCTFCGLNGTTMAFRAKSQPRALAELTHLVRKHGTTDVANADNIIDHRYFEHFVPALAAADLGLLIYYEAKANLKPWQWAALSRAGIRKVQAGIETLDTELLRLMRKGSTCVHNVAALKLAAEAGVYVEWLALCGFPGETDASYARLAALLPDLVHLQPPAAFIRARADRFSPYFDRPDDHGVALEPLPAYRHIFPADADIGRIGYHFTMRSPDLDRTGQRVGETARGYATWQAEHASSGLWCDTDGEDCVVHEQRHGRAPGVTRLTGTAAALLRLCWQPVPWRLVEAAGLDDAAPALAAAGWLLRADGHGLSLPLRQPGFRRAPSWPEIRADAMRPFCEADHAGWAPPATMASRVTA